MLRTVSEKLDSIARQDLLQQWAKLRDPLIYPKGSWLTILTEVRNAGTHRTIINKRVAVSLHEDVNTGKGTGSSKSYILYSRSRFNLGEV